MAAVNPDADSREIILAAAERLIAARGVADSSLADIASAAGVSRGTLYWHYRSKEELILDIAESHMAALTAKFVAISETGEGDGLPEIFESLFDEVLADETRSNLHMHLVHAVFEGSDPVRERLAGSYREWRRMISRQLALHGVGTKAASDAASLVVAAIDGLILQAKVAGRRDRAAERRIARFLAESIGRTAPEGASAADNRRRNA